MASGVSQNMARRIVEPTMQCYFRTINEPVRGASAEMVGEHNGLVQLVNL